MPDVGIPVSSALSSVGPSNVPPRTPYKLGVFAGLAQEVAFSKANQAAYR